MTGVKDKSRPIRVCVMSIALSIAFGSISASLERRSAQDQKTSRGGGPMHSSRRMADGKEWTAANLNVNTSPSYCYDDAESNCRRYGRLYTWEAAQRACQSLGDGWRLPTNDEWRQLAKQHGGLREESDDNGRAAYTALLTGGNSGLNAVFGGGRSDDGQYARLEAHGLYWTASESGATTAWVYNFGKGGLSLNRHRHISKQRAYSARCIRE